ncbi:MAG: hypothetical protein JXB35_15810 [Anaerolineae bacterium]|nr:hypothetical protein [Anaerolineae bacterium]
MTRKQSYRTRSGHLRLHGAERVLFIVGAVFYAVGLLGALNFLVMPVSTAIILLAIGGGIQLVNTLILIF